MKHQVAVITGASSGIGEALADIGKALWLCAATTIAGFGSLATAQTVGLASLGINCAMGIAMNALFAVFLLPTLWRWGSRQ
jgi:predicted RND superfamily exporter protein